MKGNDQVNGLSVKQLLSGAIVLSKFHGLCSLV